MKDSIDIEKLSELARIKISKEEAQELKGDIESILEYVQQVQEVSDDNTGLEVGDVHNVMREDENPHESGIYTQEIMNEAPKTKEKENGVYIEVKNIL
ncbi:MAG: Asp-tRNA(Asn)/Glu-tRNA(Gln) amidotransferase subunit GatC [Candidatus Paceibacterota bacterium]